mmetsp:Transcript_28298/g.68845  ORF Transcript_28298/g.68845 Transcript_28298/m.68845 type:complete len:92 (+) Transcript_28298:563-838(+)
MIAVSNEGAEVTVGRFGVDVVRGSIHEDSLELGDTMVVNVGFAEDWLQCRSIVVGAGMDVAHKADGCCDVKVLVEEACGKYTAPSVYSCMR